MMLRELNSVFIRLCIDIVQKHFKRNENLMIEKVN